MRTVKGRLRAHTLPELLIVLTILVLFAAVATPRFVQSLSRSRLDAAVQAARSGLDFARARAVATGLRHQVAVDAETGEILVQPFRPERLDSPVASQAQPDVALRDRLPEQVRVAAWSVSPLGYDQSASAAQDAIPLTFYPEGNSDGALLILEDEEGERRGVRVEPLTGEVRELTPEEMPR
jgi:type II secretory pathway pseudopilin PulG